MSTTSSETVTRLLEGVERYVASVERLPSATRLDKDTLEVIYDLAYHQLQQGRTSEAGRYFALLQVYAPLDLRFLLGMAACCQLENRNENAVYLYSMALYLKPQSCQIALALAESLVHAQAPVAARELLKLVVRLATSPTDSVTQERARILLNALSEKVDAEHA